MVKDFNKLCNPAKLYFVLVMLFIVIGLFSKINLMAIFFKLVFAFIWTIVLNWLCSKGYTTLSWIIVFFPFILILIAFFGYLKLSKSNTQMINMMQMKTN